MTTMLLKQSKLWRSEELRELVKEAHYDPDDINLIVRDHQLRVQLGDDPSHWLEDITIDTVRDTVDATNNLMDLLRKYPRKSYDSVAKSSKDIDISTLGLF